MVRCFNRRKCAGVFYVSCKRGETIMLNNLHWVVQALRGLDVISNVTTTPAAPTGITTQNFCSGNNPTVLNLTATGTAIKWYAASNGGSALASSIALSNGSVYYASQTVSGCEGTLRLSDTARVNPSPSVNAGAAFDLYLTKGAELRLALGGSYTGTATSAVWTDGGAGGSFTGNDGTSFGAANATYTAML